MIIVLINFVDSDTSPRRGHRPPWTRTGIWHDYGKDWKQRRELFRRLAFRRASPRLGPSKAFSSVRVDALLNPRGPFLPFDWP